MLTKDRKLFSFKFFSPCCNEEIQVQLHHSKREKPRGVSLQINPTEIL